MAAEWMPGALRNPVDSHGGLMSAHLGLVLHVTTNHFDPHGFFADAGNSASSTWWVSESGDIEQYVSALNRAWAQGAGNSTYNSVETSGLVSDPMTPAQVESVARIYAWGHGEFGWPFRLADSPGEPGLGWHGMGHSQGWGHLFCPGEPRKAQRAAVLDRASALVTPAGQLSDGLSGPSEGEDMQELVQAPGEQAIYVSNDITLRRVSGPAEATRLVHKYGPVQPRDADQLRTFPGYIDPATGKKVA